MIITTVVKEKYYNYISLTEPPPLLLINTIHRKAKQTAQELEICRTAIIDTLPDIAS